MVDFDGVLRQLGQGPDGPAVKGAVAAMRGLKAMGYNIVVHTVRAGNGPEAIKRVTDWLDEHKVEYDSVTNKKLDADHYIDDKAIQFNGNWRPVIDRVLPKDTAEKGV